MGLRLDRAGERGLFGARRKAGSGEAHPTYPKVDIARASHNFGRFFYNLTIFDRSTTQNTSKTRKPAPTPIPSIPPGVRSRGRFRRLLGEIFVFWEECRKKDPSVQLMEAAGILYNKESIVGPADAETYAEGEGDKLFFK